mgnify:CR=1 FL=1
MAVDIRRVEGDAEGREVLRVARRSFHIGMAMLISKPKWAFGAWDGDRCVGGVILKRSGRVGIVEWIFVAKEGRGRGLAKQLTDVAMREFAEKGIETAAAIVRDDNTASWNLFAARGFKAMSIGGAIQALGIGDYLRVVFSAFKITAVGFDLWIGSVGVALEPSVRGEPDPGDTVPGNSVTSLIFHLIVNCLPVAFGWLLFGDEPLPFLAAIVAILAVRLLFSFVTVRASGLRVRLRSARGGLLPVLITDVFQGILFYPAFWQPKTARWREPDHRGPLSAAALVGAVAVMALVVGAGLIARGGAGGPLTSGPAGPFVLQTAAILRVIGKFVIAFELNPIFEAFAGPRVLRWKWWVYAIAAAAAVVVIVLV